MARERDIKDFFKQQQQPETWRDRLDTGNIVPENLGIKESAFKEKNNLSEEEFVAFKEKAQSHKMTLDDIHYIINKDKVSANVAQNTKQDMLNQMKNVRNMPTSASGANSQGETVSEERDVFNSILGNDSSVDNLFG